MYVSIWSISTFGSTRDVNSLFVMCHLLKNTEPLNVEQHDLRQRQVLGENRLWEFVHERLLSSCFSVILVVIGTFRVWGLKSDPSPVRRLSNFRWVWARPADGRWRLMDGARLRLSQMTSWFQAILKLTAVTLRLGMRRGCPLLSCLLLLLSPPIPSHPLLPLHHLHRLLPLFSFIASLLSFTPFTFWPVLLYFLSLSADFIVVLWGKHGSFII